MKRKRFSDEVAVVTGGAAGIGKAIVEQLVDEGAAVAILDLDEGRAAELVASLGPGAFGVEADVGDDAAVAAAFERVREALGDPTVLVNNAARLSGHGPVLGTSAGEWEAGIRGTLTSVYLCSRQVLPAMIERRRGAIVNVASVGGVVGFAGFAAYTSAKAGVIQLTKSLAIDYGPAGIRVNAVSPGAIDTDGNRRFANNLELRRYQESNSVFGRTGSTAEVAAGVAFLASEEASFVTGANLLVDGGWSLR